MKHFYILIVVLLTLTSLPGQETFPENGAADHRENFYFLTGGTIHPAPGRTIEKGDMIIRRGTIIAVSEKLDQPNGAIKIDMEGKHIYPSFIDLNSNYGIPEADYQESRPSQQKLTSGKKGAFYWNESLIPEYDASSEFHHNETEADKYREAGIGTLLTHRSNGIVRGSGLLTTLADEAPHLTILEAKASSHLSFTKAKSYQSPPSSQMGMIALLRQLYLNGEWYQLAGKKEQTNLSLDAWQHLKNLPQFFSVSDKLEVLRAAKIAKEFNNIYIIEGNGDEYQRAAAIAQTEMPLIIPVNFPAPYDVEDPLDADRVSLHEMKHWEWAPNNPNILEQHKIPFAFTSKGLKNKKDFLPNIRKAIQYGLSEDEAIRALTIRPAKWLNQGSRLGQLKKGFIANFLVTDGPVFNPKTTILENWIQGKSYYLNDGSSLAGSIFDLNLENKKYRLEINESATGATIFYSDNKKIKGNVTQELDRVLIIFQNEEGYYLRLNGIIKGNNLTGQYQDESGKSKKFHAEHADTKKIAESRSSKDSVLIESKFTFPFIAYGRTMLPESKTYLIRGATVWTNTPDGIKKSTDVLIENGKIAAIGILKAPAGAEVIDGKNMHLTPGIIDEHSHIAISKGINEGTLASSAAVRIGDILNSEDINIYRQLAGGVTTSHILHGSANPIGGQAALIKLRWGFAPEEMKIEGADPFIKFALGENVKQSNWGDQNTIRFPQTRMGVEQLYEDYFTRAREYGELKKGQTPYRKDLEMETLLEILEGKRFITCHSYVQSEINMLMHLADRYDFKINTFTHILEGYKVADKMKSREIAAATFSDWWAYKYEVIDAIPYNATIMHDVGVVTALNSDDAEMARRLHSEAGKAIKYGGMSPEEALKLVTLNPAKMLHIDDRVGRISVGMDADVVLWNGPPLSTFTRAEKTFVDGKLFFDRKENEAMAEEIKQERNRLIQKMLREKKEGAPTQKPSNHQEKNYQCDTLEF